MSDVDKLPRWLKPMNLVIVALQRRGLALGTMRVLSVPGRRSGRMRTTPVSPLVVGGQRYVVGGSAQADWVKNARAAGWGVLAHGREEEWVRLVELPVEERAPVLQEFPKKVPGGIPFFRSMYGLPKEKEALPEAFAALAPRCAVFRLEVSRHPDRQLWRYGLEEKPRGFQVLPRRWVVERTFAWLGLSRRFSKDYERLPETAEAMVYGAMSRLMMPRLARAA